MQITKEYMNNHAIQGLVGPNNIHLHQIEEHMKVQIFLNGNQMIIDGSSRDAPMTSEILDTLYIAAQRKGDITEDDIIRAVASVQGETTTRSSGDLSLKTQKRHISPRTQTQAEFVQAMNDYEYNQMLTILTGAGILSKETGIEKNTESSPDELIRVEKEHQAMIDEQIANQERQMQMSQQSQNRKEVKSNGMI